mmetsp:Transcript_1141/g.4077  ORF Transcript_1141/g.4077 Transcript_1141/m.4077 type:complete len:410 (+) Transcript_1141:164-1393(+)
MMEASSQDAAIRSICEVSLFTPVSIDIFVFRLWLHGASAQEIVQEQMKKKLFPQGYDVYVRDVLHSPNPMQAVQKMLLHDVKGQIRNFSLLSHYLSDPVQLLSQNTFYLPKETRDLLVEEYYQIDGNVMLEMIGKRFKSSKRKKAIDLLAERLHVPPVLCARQYSNLVVAYKAAQSTGPATVGSAGNALQLDVQQEADELVVERIRKALHVSRALAFDYAKAAFLVIHKFDVGRSSLQALKYKHFDAMAVALIRWCPGVASDPTTALELSLERSFLDSLKALKGILGREALEEYRQHVLRDVGEGKLASKRAKIEKEFIPFVKSLLSVISALEPREFQNFFGVVHDKVREPCKRMDLAKKEAMVLFRLLIAAFHPLALKDCSAAQKSAHAKVWARYLGSLAECLMLLYA